MHVYNRTTKALKSFSNFKDLVEYYLNQKAADQSDLFFWNFGLEDWILARNILTDQILEEKGFAIPKFPVSLESHKGISPSPGNSPEELSTVKVDLKDEGFRVIEWAAPPPPPPTALKGDNKIHSSKTVPEGASNFTQQRKFKRYVVRLKIIISNKQKTFLSYSKNISEGGILLEDRIPKYMFNEKSEVFISSPSRREIIAFRCLPLGDEENPNRLIFQQSQREHLEKLKLWLESAKLTAK
ncbi:MAG: PilZ domain-containing protein [Bdellovibrionales bacterium]|nr:PilZ domain-containing protein [Bdellovibrionales bacterium]